ncbi:MAG: cytochrome-c oxidase, cbb3-type subunit I, partial [Pseudomonadota bacterium]
MANVLKLTALGLVALFAAIAVNFAEDLAYQVHAIIILLVSVRMFFWVMGQSGKPAAPVEEGYMDGVVRAGVIATMF